MPSFLDATRDRSVSTVIEYNGISNQLIPHRVGGYVRSDWNRNNRLPGMSITVSVGQPTYAAFDQWRVAKNPQASIRYSRTEAPQIVIGSWPPQTYSQWRCLMTAKYDIFNETPQNDFVWVEAADDIVAAKKTLINLTSSARTEYRLWDSTEQKFVNL
jgi:hypothetical protein